MSRKQKKEAIEKWNAYKPLRDAARERLGITGEVDPNDLDYKKILSEARAKLSQPAAPAMPCMQTQASPRGDATASATALAGAARPHDEHVAPKGWASEEWFALVHTQIPIPKALKIPEGRAALDKEWAKLERPDRPAWDVTKVRPRAEVEAESERTGIHAHFGSLMDLCHIKNSQLGKEFWTYKGRIVFRGDIVKDESGQFAVFTGQ